MTYLGRMRFNGLIALIHWTGKPSSHIPLLNYGIANPCSHRIVASLAWLISWWIKFQPPFERDFDSDDPLIGHKHRQNQYEDSLFALAEAVDQGRTLL